MKVMFTKNDIAEQRNYNAAMRAIAFITYNGAELCELLEFLKEEEAFDELCTLHAQIGISTPNISAVQNALHHIVETLVRQAPSKLDKLSETSHLDANIMVNWFGAKLTDLLASFAPKIRIL